MGHGIRETRYARRKVSLRSSSTHAVPSPIATKSPSHLIRIRVALHFLPSFFQAAQLRPLIISPDLWSSAAPPCGSLTIPSLNVDGKFQFASIGSALLCSALLSSWLPLFPQAAGGNFRCSSQNPDPAAWLTCDMNA